MEHSKLLEKILFELSLVKKGLPNGELKQVKESTKEIKEDITELKKLLLNPEEGVVVKVNKNTEFRLQEEAANNDNIKNIQDLEALKKWRDSVTRALWIIFTTLIGIGIKIVFFNE